MVRFVYPLLMLLFSLTAYAADIQVEMDRNQVALNETFRISFIVKGSQDGEPDFSPLNKDFQLLGTSQSSSFNMINGNVSSSKTYTLTVAANREGQLTIPPISFGKDISQPVNITVTGANQPATSPAPNKPVAPGSGDDALFMEASVDTRDPYVQQQVILTVKIYRRVDWANAKLSDIGIKGVEAAIQPLAEEKNYETTLQGKRYVVTELRYALFPQLSGELVIQPFQLTAKIPTGTKKRSKRFGGSFDPFNDPFFDDFFSGSRTTYTNKTISSEAIELNIKPIPASFKGKHWLPAKDVQLQQTWSEDIGQLESGEPVTRTLAIVADGLGVGQLPKLSFEDLPGLKLYPDQPVNNEQATDKGLLITQTHKLAIIPSQGGQFQLPAIEIPWWNTVTDKLEVARIPQQQLVAKGPVPATQPTTASATPGATPTSPAAADQPSTKPILTETEQPILPYQWLLVICGVLLFLWLATLAAWYRKRKNHPTVEATLKQTDNSPSLREANKRLQQACKQNEAPVIRDALIQWATTTWPQDPPANLEDISSRVPQSFGNELHALSRTLYSNEPGQWHANTIAQEALAFSPPTTKLTKDVDGLEPLYR